MDYKSWLENNNIVTYKILNNSFNNNKISHAYLFSSQHGQSIENEYIYLIQKLVPQSNKDNPLNYSDLIFIDGSKDFIKKEQIISATNKLQQTSLDPSGTKILVIKNIENSNHYSLNSLLKFIEEPTKNTYILMTTNNISSILSTIKSRSQIINIPPININNWINEIKKWNYPIEFANLIGNLYKTKKEIEKNFNDNFKKIHSDIIQILNKSLNDKNDFIISLKNLVNFQNWKIVFSLLNLFFNDIWKLNQLLDLCFPKEKGLIKKYINSNFNFKKAIEDINEFFMFKEQNLNFELTKNNLILKIGDCYE